MILAATSMSTDDICRSLAAYWEGLVARTSSDVKAKPAFKHSDAASLRFYDLFSEFFSIKEMHSISPIQGYCRPGEGEFT